MHDSKPSVWSAFQQLANEYPDCNAVKLTLNLQRDFISMQQQHFLQRVSDAVGALTEPELEFLTPR